MKILGLVISIMMVAGFVIVLIMTPIANSESEKCPRCEQDITPEIIIKMIATLIGIPFLGALLCSGVYICLFIYDKYKYFLLEGE